ncbi:MAG: alkaline phosphatase family protein, partial [Alphaproteobacteria bacterium]|nr:alkaline phosphatase family protein [Alphaproteobacteria bacterium]
MAKVILIMIDGISAEHFKRYRHHLPVMDQLAEKGCLVSSLTPEMCGTSCPGRSSIISSAPPAAHGIYANKIFDPAQNLFRWASPYDLRGETVAGYAKQQGLDVAALGYGMVRPEDCNIYYG